MGNPLLDMVSKVWKEPWRIKQLNDTFLCLIPKVDGVTHMKQFRPIGLCNVSYKIITKPLARWIREFLPKLVGPAQCAFVPHRHSQDNIVVAQKIFHSMRSKKGKNGWMAIKIDLEKVYDRLKWTFIKETLLDIELLTPTINLIWY